MNIPKSIESQNLHNLIQKRTDYGRATYEIFLKDRLFDSQLHYFSVIQSQAINTYDGIAYKVRYSDLDTNPDLEPIGICKINGESIFAWREHCWRLASNELINGASFCSHAIHNGYNEITIYKIGVETIL